MSRLADATVTDNCYLYPIRHSRSSLIRASSSEPGQPGWLGFRDLASPLFYLQKYRCVHMRGRAGPDAEISVFATDISVTGMKIFPHEHSSLITGTKLFKQNSVALATYGPKWHNFGLVCTSSLGVCELALIVKLQDSTKL